MELPRIPLTTFAPKDIGLGRRTIPGNPLVQFHRNLNRHGRLSLSPLPKRKHQNGPRPLGLLPIKTSKSGQRNRAESLPLPLPILQKTATKSSPTVLETTIPRRAKTENFRVGALIPLKSQQDDKEENPIEDSTEEGRRITISVNVPSPVEDNSADEDVQLVTGAFEKYLQEIRASDHQSRSPSVPKRKTKASREVRDSYAPLRDRFLRMPEKAIPADQERAYFSFVNQKVMVDRDKWRIDKRSGLQWIPCARCLKNGGRCRRCVCIRVGGGYIILDDAINGSDFVTMTEEEKQKIIESGVFAKEPTCSRCHSAVLSRGRMDRPMSGVIDPSGRRSSMSRRSGNPADDESDFELSRRQLVDGSDEDRASSPLGRVGSASRKRSLVGARRESGKDDSSGNNKGAFDMDGGPTRSMVRSGDGRNSRLEDVAETEYGGSSADLGGKGTPGLDRSGVDGLGAGNGDGSERRHGKRDAQNLKKGRKDRTTKEKDVSGKDSDLSSKFLAKDTDDSDSGDDQSGSDDDESYYRKRGELPPVGRRSGKDKKKNRRHRDIDKPSKDLPGPPQKDSQEFERGRLRQLQRDRNEASALKCTLKDLEGIDPLDYLAKYCIISPERLPHYERSYLNVARDEEDKITLEQLDFALKAVNYDLITDAEMDYISHVLELPGRKDLNFKLFACIAALSERVVGLEPMVKDLINQMNLAALDYKLKKCKELFYLLASENDGGVVTSSALAIELHAGGLTKEHEEYVVDRLDKEKTGRIEFLDYLVYVPLFVEIHDSICGNPFEFSRTK
ncbi:uncharacterized protein [Oscarella lobularis]|uniref:uncharacterized protein isoform X2 n=1 Tax=Oscarella lobularis TaxID=121494 RepID=UPI003313E402